MAYDEELANRVREVIADVSGVSEKQMFGGLTFLLHGNMSVSVSSKGGLLVRLDPAEADALAAEPHTDRFMSRGRTMKGWLRVLPAGIEADDDLARWVDRSVTYVRSLPAK
jgi:TfoX/Sxy family transcriptional regulator of competence genes